MKLNNKGQSLVLFVLVLPIVIIIFSLVFDIGNAYSNKTMLNDICYLSVDYGIDGYKEEDIRELIIKNNKNIKIDSIEINGEEVSVKLTYESKAFFSSIKFNLSSEYVGNKESKKIERVR